MQYTIRCDYRNTVTKSRADGKEEKHGVFPTVIQSKFRIDDKRPMAKDGKEKQPWSKSDFFHLQSLFYDCSKSKLYSIVDFPKCSKSRMISLELNDQDKNFAKFSENNDIKIELHYINEAVASNFEKMNDVMQQVKEILSRNEILLIKCRNPSINNGIKSNFLHITRLMLQVKELLLQNDKIFWDYTHFESGFI